MIVWAGFALVVVGSFGLLMGWRPWVLWATLAFGGLALQVVSLFP